MPSGTLWATENIKDDNGNELYFAWGETQGYTAGQVGTDKSFAWDDYKYGFYDSEDWPDCGMTKYNSTDGLTVLDSEDDAATANWGPEWRMPTKEQFEELKENTTSAWTQVDGVNGMLLTSKANNNTLFFPAVGSAENDGLVYVGGIGLCWSVSLSDVGLFNAWKLELSDGDCGVYYSDRNIGYSVRPIRAN